MVAEHDVRACGGTGAQGLGVAGQGVAACACGWAVERRRYDFSFLVIHLFVGIFSMVWGGCACVYPPACLFYLKDEECVFGRFSVRTCLRVVDMLLNEKKCVFTIWCILVRL
jgi:hypothetical protein